MSCLELILGGIIGAIISNSWQRINDWIFGIRYLRKLKGKYKCYYKNGSVVNNIKEIEVTNVRFKSVEMITINSKGEKWKSEIYFENSKYGKGWYKEEGVDESEIDISSKHTFGIREVIIVSDTQFNIWDKYSKDKSYGSKADFSTINHSYFCLKI